MKSFIILLSIIAVFIICISLSAKFSRNFRDYLIYGVAHVVPIENIFINSDSYLKLKDSFCLNNSQLNTNNTIVFAGDSHVRKFNLEQYFISPKYTLLNRGIKSDTTTGLLSRFKETINNIKTDKLVLIIGYNDLKYRDNSKIIYNYDKILTTATAKTVYVFSVFPVGKNRTWFNSRIIELNRGIKKLCVKYNIIYVDMFPYLVYPDGGLKDEYSLDGTHLNTTGYNVLASVLNKLLFNHND